MSESQNIEWKETWRDEYLKWVCGFANAQGGVLEIGKEAGNPTPKWELEPGGDGLWLRFPFSATYQVSDSPVGSASTPKATPKTTQETTQERILALLEAEPELTQRLLAERIGLTPDGVKYHLTKLRAAGAIRHVGSTKAGRWEVLK